MHLNPESPLGCLPSGMSIALFRSSETKGALEAHFSLPNAVSRRGGMTVSHLDRNCNRVVCSVDTGSVSRPKISTVVLVPRRTFMTIWKRRPGRPRSRSRSQQAPTDSRRAATATGRRRRPPTVIVPRPTVVTVHRRRPATGRRRRPPTVIVPPPTGVATHRHRPATGRRLHPPSLSCHRLSSSPTAVAPPLIVVAEHRRRPATDCRPNPPSSSCHRLSSSPTVVVPCRPSSLSTVVISLSLVAADRCRPATHIFAAHRRCSAAHRCVSARLSPHPLLSSCLPPSLPLALVHQVCISLRVFPLMPYVASMSRVRSPS